LLNPNEFRNPEDVSSRKSDLELFLDLLKLDVTEPIKLPLFVVYVPFTSSIS